LQFGKRDKFLQRLCRYRRVYDDHKVGDVDRRNRHQITHQLIFTLRHQRFVGGLVVRHHQQRVTVRCCLGGFLGTDHGAGAGTVLDHERLLEAFLQGVAEQPCRHIRRSSGPEWNDDPNGSCRVVLSATNAEEKTLDREQEDCQQCDLRDPQAVSGADGSARHIHLFNLPCGPERLAKSIVRV
jgi:hypothetical protein